ncbi:MAG: orc1/cdc6 family replication initiation protein [Candidatus Nitrosocaldaceae archaeon]
MCLLSIDEIFNKIVSSRSLIKDRAVLRADYVPDKLLFRNNEITAVAEVLSPLLKGYRASNLLLYGKPGTGKTAVARYVLKHLQRKANELNIKIALAYSNTKTANREYTMLVELGNSIGLKFPFTGLASSELFTRILNYINNYNLNTVFVLDEIDFLVKRYGDEILYQMTRSNERLENGSLGLVGISNDLNFKEFLDPRVLSSLSEEEVVFAPYSVNELKEILLERVELGFYKDTVNTSAINLCAAIAGSEHGDARRAVDLLRVAGEVAEREGAVKVEERHIRIAEKKIEQDKVTETLRRLPLHEKLVMYSILLADNGITGDVYSKYLELTKKLSIEPVTQRRIGMMISELDMQGLIYAPIINKGRHGRTKKITLAIQHSLLKQAIEEDPLTNGIL